MLLVPDQLRSGVSKPHRYEPEIQRTYEEMGEHYGVAVLPRGRARRETSPRSRWPCKSPSVGLSHACATKPSSLWRNWNERIAELLEDLNNRVMRRYGKTRRQLFEELDRPALRPLPAQRFVWGDWKNAGVNIDYHIDVEHHYYSVPFTLVHERVDARFHRQHSGDLSTRAGVWLRTCAATCVAGTPRTRSTCRNPPRPRRVDADTHAQVGRDGRTQDGGTGHPRSSTRSRTRARLPRLPGHPATGQTIRRATT